MKPSSPVRRRLRLLQATVLGAALLALVVGPATAADHAVDVGDNFFEPQEITITAGDTVNWTYQGSVNHDVDLEDGSFQSEDFATDGSESTISFTFEEAGTYNYFCSYHAACEDGECFGEMWGTVTVEAAAEPTDEPTTEAPTDEPTDEPTTEAPTPEPTEDPTPDEASTEAASTTNANDMPNTGNGTPMVLAVALLTAGFLGLRRRGLVG